MMTQAFDPTEPEQIVREAWEGFNRIWLAKTLPDYQTALGFVQDSDWIRRLKKTRDAFIATAGKMGLCTENAIDAFNALWEAALRIQRESSSIVTIFTEAGNRKIDSLTKKLKLTDLQRWDIALELNDSLKESLNAQYFRAMNGMSELSSYMRPDEAIEKDCGVRPLSPRRKMAIELLEQHVEMSPSAEWPVRYEWVNAKLKVAGFTPYLAESLERFWIASQGL